MFEDSFLALIYAASTRAQPAWTPGGPRVDYTQDGCLMDVSYMFIRPIDHSCVKRYN